MEIMIFQCKTFRDTLLVSDQWYDRQTVTVDPALYNLVYANPDFQAGTILPGSSVLEEIFYLFNIQRPEDFCGWSLSVGDVVILDSMAHVVCPVGFQRVRWDLQGRKMEGLPGLSPHLLTMKALQCLRREPKPRLYVTANDEAHKDTVRDTILWETLRHVPVDLWKELHGVFNLDAALAVYTKEIQTKAFETFWNEIRSAS